jgi:hypothetical protein
VIANADMRQLAIGAAAVDRRSADAEETRDLFNGQVLMALSGCSGVLHYPRLSGEKESPAEAGLS